MEFFEVGGCVRDEVMGHPSKDIDFVCVLDPAEVGTNSNPFHVMRNELRRRGFRIFQETEKFLTIRAQFPRGFSGMASEALVRRPGLTADFVLARKEGDYTDGRRPDEVMPGTLEDDLDRRDFTMNAIAKAADGSLIDPFHGVLDIKNRKIRCVGSAEDRLREDALRGLRALRFSVTKGMVIDSKIVSVLNTPEFVTALASVSKERQREEMEKMFLHDTVRALRLLAQFPAIERVVFSDGLRLTATMKEK